MAEVKEILELLEVASAPATKGKVRKGVNEVTKAIERGTAKLVVIADDVSPKELLAHLPILCKEKNIKLLNVPTKEELGNAVGIATGCSSVAVLTAGEAEGKELLMKVIK